MGIIGFVIVLVLVALGTMIGGKVGAFFDNPSFVFMLGFVVGCLLISRTSIRLLFRSLHPGTLSESEIREAIRGWRSTRAFAMSGGCLGTLMGLMTMLHSGNSDLFGLGIATAMIPIFYGALLSYVVCLPIQYRLEGELLNGSRKMTPSDTLFTMAVIGVAGLIWRILDEIYHIFYPNIS